MNATNSPLLFSGYLNNPQATASTLTPDGWIRTGDLGLVDADALRAWLAERLAPHKQLADVVTIDAIPKNPSGKLLRRVLRAQDAARTGPSA